MHTALKTCLALHSRHDVLSGVVKLSHSNFLFTIYFLIALKQVFCFFSNVNLYHAFRSLAVNFSCHRYPSDDVTDPSATVKSDKNWSRPWRPRRRAPSRKARIHRNWPPPGGSILS